MIRAKLLADPSHEGGMGEFFSHKFVSQVKMGIKAHESCVLWQGIGRCFRYGVYSACHYRNLLCLYKLRTNGLDSIESLNKVLNDIDISPVVNCDLLQVYAGSEAVEFHVSGNISE